MRTIIRACPFHTEWAWKKIPDWLYRRTIAQLANAGCDAIGLVVDAIPSNARPKDIENEMLLPFKYYNDLYDLNQPNPEYYEKLKYICRMFRSYGCRPHLMLYLQEYGNWPRWSPWQHNIQAMSSLYWPPAGSGHAIRFPFVDAVVEATKEFDPIYYVGCELDAEMPALIDLHNSTLERLMIYHKVSIKSCGFGFDFKRYMVEGGDNRGAELRRGVEAYFLNKINPQTGLVFYDRTSWDLYNYLHNCGTINDTNVQQFYKWHSNSGIPHILSEDGKIPRMTPLEAAHLMGLILSRTSLYNIWGIDFHPSEYFIDTASTVFGYDIDLNKLYSLGLENIKAASETYKQMTGSFPDNWQRYALPEKPIDPEPEPPQPEPKPCKHSAWYWISWNSLNIKEWWNALFHKGPEWCVTHHREWPHE